MAQMLQILLLFLATFTPKATAEKLGILTVTVDPHHISNVRYFDVYLKQAEEDNEYAAFEDCENATTSSRNPIEFTLDWSKCPRAVVHPEQLKHLQIEIDVVYKGGSRRQPDQMHIWLEYYSSGFYRRVFGGGKARLVKFLKTDGFSKELKEYPKLVYFEDPTGTHIPPAATLTFNVEYQHRTVSSIRHVEVEHASNSESDEDMSEVEMGECQPENMRGGKFSLDLSKCNVHDMGDFLDLQMELRVALQKGQHPNRVEGLTELVKFGMLSNAPENVLRQLYSEAVANTYIKRLSQLPTEAVEALGGIIMKSRHTPKQLQFHADELSKKLEKRQFPAQPHEVQRVRKEVLEEIYADFPGFHYEYRIWKNRPGYDRELNKEVQKRLAARRFNWKPLTFKNNDEAIIYALSRFGSHFAEMRRVLAEFDRNGFVPEKVLDYGSGIGSAFWAAYERWGDKVREYSLIDPDLSIRHFSMDLLRGRNFSGTGQLITKNLFFRKELFPSPQHTYDLVILHRTLIECGSHEQRIELVEKLWQRTNKYMVIVETPMPDAFKALMNIRDHIVTGGYDFDPERTKELLYRYGQLDQDTIELFADRRVQTYEKYLRAREKLPETVQIPTRLEMGHVFAPCPHDQRCPLLKRKEPCKFMVRWQEFRADHRTRSPNRDGTETGTFSYLILAKGERPKGEDEPFARILELKKARHCVSCRVCTASNGVQRFVTGKRNGKVYKRIWHTNTSQLLPVKFELLKTDPSPTQFPQITPADDMDLLGGPEEDSEEEMMRQIVSREEC